MSHPTDTVRASISDERSSPRPGSDIRVDRAGEQASIPSRLSTVHRAPVSALFDLIWGPCLFALVIVLIAPPSQRRQALEHTVDEPLPIPTAHFLIGNEGRHDIFARAIGGRGGAFLGVGGEQNYTLAALADAERVYLLDRDPWIALLHKELGRRIIKSSTPSDLLDGLDDPLDPRAAELVATWPTFSEHLRRFAARQVEGRATTWLGDQALYTRIRNRWREGADIPVTGDLTGDTAMASIARATAAHDLRFTTIYLSNAEESLPSLVLLASNLSALPRAPNAVVLRTFFHESLLPVDGLWSYQIQALADLLVCVETTPGTSLRGLIDAALRGDALTIDPQEPGLSTMDTRASTSASTSPQPSVSIPALRSAVTGMATRRTQLGSTRPTPPQHCLSAWSPLRPDGRAVAADPPPRNAVMK